MPRTMESLRDENNNVDCDETIVKYRYQSIIRTFKDYDYGITVPSFSEMDNMTLDELREKYSDLREAANEYRNLSNVNMACLEIREENPRTISDVISVFLKDYNPDNIEKKLGIIMSSKIYFHIFLTLNLEPPISHDVYKNTIQELKPPETLPPDADEECHIDFAKKYFPQEWECLESLLLEKKKEN